MEKIYVVDSVENGKRWKRILAESDVSENSKKETAGEKDVFDFYIKQDFLNGKCYLPECKLENSSEKNFGRHLKIKNIYIDNNLYFAEKLKLEDLLSPNVRCYYDNGKGYELSSGKFFSVGSSSRFTVASFTQKNNERLLDFINEVKIENISTCVKHIEFEHALPIKHIRGRSPQLDVFLQTEKSGTYFFEVKCHEIFDDAKHKNLELKWKYADNKIFKKVCKVSLNKSNQYEDIIHIDGRKLQAIDFGCAIETTHFDFKQFLCHLMGICSYQEQHSDEQLHFWYLFYKNDEFIKQTNSKIYDELEAELSEVFEHFSKLFPSIEFGYCYNDEFTTLKSLKNKFIK